MSAIITGLAGKRFIFTQSTPSQIWTINHNLGYYPVAHIYTTALELVSCEVQHISTNQIKLTFTSPFSGTAQFF